MKKGKSCENLELMSVNSPSTEKQPEAGISQQRNTAGPQKSSDGRVSLYKRISLLLACVWILSLISGLAVYFFLGSVDKQSEMLKLQENNTARITELQREKETLQTEHSVLLRNNKNMTESCLLTERSNTELKKQLQNKENENSNLQSKYSNVKAGCDELQREKETLQTEHSVLLRNNKNMTESCLLTERSNTELKKQLQNKENENSNLQSKYSNVKAGCDVWKWLRYVAVDVTLDPNTVNPFLILSEDGKQVRHGDERQVLRNNPKRFDYVICVLGKESFSSGRHYWEVEVGEKTAWTLGVARESINRKGKITVSPGLGFWTLTLRNGNELMAATSPPVLLPLSLKPRKVGVFVDYEGGQVSFYNVEARSHIYTFTDTFTEKLYPFFGPALTEGGKNAAPLIISPVHHTD
ncbi:E3 ubiquitin-protein ligase TRIM39 [Amia ocellicauda]|uniref:E3 ubiquitin-protein ligase TRIM39 n=1 Tax=Amia ocellicauda TaxID=2972642 RepID=UPI003463FD01